MENQVPFQWLKCLQRLEAALNIHRNYRFVSRRRRFVLSLLILIDILGLVIPYLFKISFLLYKPGSAVVVSILTILWMYIMQNVLTVSYYAPKHGVEFKKLLQVLNCSHNLFQHCPLYRKSLRRLNIQCAAVTTLFFVFKIFSTIGAAFITRHFDPYLIKRDVFGFIIFNFIKLLVEMRTIFECMVYYALLMVILNIYQNLNKSLKSEQDLANGNLRRCATVYQQLFECGALVKTCFGNQVLFSLGIMTCQFVLVTYNLIFDIISSQFGEYKGFHYSFNPGAYTILAVYSMSLLILSKAGQDIHNETVILKRTLASFNCRAQETTGPISPEMQCLKDLHRLVTLKPINFQLLPRLPLGMCLLPGVLSLIVNYVIAALQLNNMI